MPPSMIAKLGGIAGISGTFPGKTKSPGNSSGSHPPGEPAPPPPQAPRRRPDPPGEPRGRRHDVRQPELLRRLPADVPLPVADPRARVVGLLEAEVEAGLELG